MGSSDILMVFVYLRDYDDSDVNTVVLFWKFDASNPVAPILMTYILQLTDKYEYERELHLNAKYFCKEEVDQLKVFAIEDTNNNATNKSWIVPLESDSKSTWLENGDSRRFAIINKEGEDRELKLISIESGNCFFSLKLNTISQLITDSGWKVFDYPCPKIKFHLGKLIFLLPLRKQEGPSKCRYQFGIINEEAKNQVVKGAALNYDLIDEGDWIYPPIGSGYVVKNHPNYITSWKI